MLALFFAPIALPIMALSRLRLSRPPAVAGLLEANNVAGLIQALHCREPGYVRANAARALGELGSAEVVDLLVPELGGKGGLARVAAAYAIGHYCRPPR